MSDEEYLNFSKNPHLFTEDALEMCREKEECVRDVLRETLMDLDIIKKKIEGLL